MDKEDGRKLSRQEQHERRKQAVRMHRRGMGIKEIAANLSMSVNTVRSAVKLAQDKGIKALSPKPTGRGLGQQRRLSADQELHIQRQICKNRPEQSLICPSERWAKLNPDERLNADLKHAPKTNSSR